MDTEEKRKRDVVVVGGGPCGLAAAIELQKQGLDALIIEKGGVTESLLNYPDRLSFFSTPENIAIGDIPFPTSNIKPTRNEAIQYYRKVALYYELDIRLYTEVTDIVGEKGSEKETGFVVTTADGTEYRARYVVIATGYFDVPRKLGVAGEDLSHVSHYYRRPYPDALLDVVVVGGGNSAIEAALELYRHDARVTLVHRGADLKPTAKKWLVPDLQNRIKEGHIRALFNRSVQRIGEKELVISDLESGEMDTLSADVVYLLVGYLPDKAFLEKVGLRVDPDELTVDLDDDSLETSIPGLFLCGTVAAGVRTERVFIENGRDHARKIARYIGEKEG